MIIALAGKGGAGKTTIAATLARSVARTGRRVVAVDADSNPNLSFAIGVRASSPPALPVSLVSRRLTGAALTEPVDSVVERYSVVAPDGVRVLVMGAPGHAEEGCLCAAHATVSAVLHDLREQSETLAVVDLEASPEHLSRGTARHADVLLLVAEPYFRSLESVRRQAALADELPIGRVVVVANKIRGSGDVDAINEFCLRHGLELIGSLPWSDAVVRADTGAVPVIEAAGGADVVGSITALAERLLSARPALP